MRKIVGIILTLSLFVSLFSIHTSAASADPYITTPAQKLHCNANESVEIKWNAPTGTVTSYVLNVRHLSANAEYEPTADYLTDPYLIVRMLSLPSVTRSYTIPWSKLTYGSCYRISVCANMSDGSKRWSNEVYFFTATYKAVANNTVSFYLYEGFPTAWKDAIYYAAQAWRKTPLGSALDYETVNTYPYSKCHNSTSFTSGDGKNRITSALPSASSNSAMSTKFQRTTSGAVKEVDININTRDFDWAVGAQSNCMDIQSVMTHEMGHAAGLAHCYQTFANGWTMKVGKDKNDISGRSLENGDKELFFDLYFPLSS